MLKELILDLQTCEVITRDKVKIAIERLQAFEPPEGYYLAFSGGKDSQCIYHLAQEAGVKFDAHYNITGIDPPEVVYFMRANYPEVKHEQYKQSMFKLIEKKGLPCRVRRWCCAELKEHGGKGRICVTGVRWAESVRRKTTRKAFEVVGARRKDGILFNDNEDDRRLFENCIKKGKRVVNPIIDWEDSDVWEYLNTRQIKHCILYDQGYERIGCIGCPMAGQKRIQEFQKYPKIEQGYKRAAGRYLESIPIEIRDKKKMLKDINSLWKWWMSDKADMCNENQIEIQFEE